MQFFRYLLPLSACKKGREGMLSPQAKTTVMQCILRIRQNALHDGCFCLRT